MSFAKNFVATTVSAFYEQVEVFAKTNGIDMPPVADFMAFVEVEQTETKKQSKRTTTAPGRGKVAKKSSKDDTKSEKEEDKNDDQKCSFVGSRGGKCKSNAKPDCNGMCKKHFDMENSGEKKAPKKPAAKKAAAKNSKGLSSAVAKELDNEEDTKEPMSDEEPVRSRTTRRVKKLDDNVESKEDDTKMTTEPNYVSTNFNRDSTSYVFDENSENKFVYKKGDYNTVYAVVRRGTAVPLSPIDIEDVKAAGKTVGKTETDSKEETTTRRRRE